MILKVLVAFEVSGIDPDKAAQITSQISESCEVMGISFDANCYVDRIETRADHVGEQA